MKIETLSRIFNDKVYTTTTKSEENNKKRLLYYLGITTSIDLIDRRFYYGLEKNAKRWR